MKTASKLSQSIAIIPATATSAAMPPSAAVWMVKQSLPVSKREAGLKLFDEKFADEYEKSDCDVEARNWALRHGWEALHSNYKPMIVYRAVQNQATVAPVFHRCGRRKSRPLFVLTV